MSRPRAWLRTILPKTLYARSLMLVLLPTLLVQAVTTTMFYTRHWDNVSRHMAISMANEIAYAVRRAQNTDSRQVSLALAQQYFGLQASWGAPVPVESVSPDERFSRLVTELETRLDAPFTVRSFGPQEDMLVLVHMKEGTLRILASGKRVASPTTYIFLLWINGAALVFLTIAVLFLRNQVKPIEQLSEVAEAFGRGQEYAGYKPRGAQEIRRAGQAFLLMRERIRRQVAKRTHMLAAISHDLRTPLTRMKLQIAMMKDAESRDDLNRDIAEMEAMISEYLDFVRGEGTEPARECSIQALLNGLAADYERQGKPFELVAPRDATLPLREQSIRRALSNLLNNAQRHGSHVRLGCQITKANIRITVEDNGPGMGEGDYGKAMEAFQRLDEARTPLDASAGAAKKEGGVGLGLAIAKDVVLSHGGLIRLGRSGMGGLMVEITLPR
jgi:two-component system osmolarity sensor histidine kinase EnvZ